MKVTVKKEKTIFVFKIKSKSSDQSWLVMKKRSELKEFYKRLCTVLAQAPQFPGSYNPFSSIDVQTNKLKDWVQEVLNLAKLLEPVRVVLEEEFEIRDVSRHIRNGDLKMVEYLVKQKLLRKEYSSEEKTQQVSTLLHMAAAWGDEKCVKLLLENGYGADVVDSYSLTPSDVARERGHEGIVKLLSSERKEESVGLPTIYTVHPLKRRFLVFVNPQAGVKNGVVLWENLVKPIFDEVGINYEVIITTHQGQVRELVQSLDCSNYETFLIVSGDGLLFELLNGLYLNKAGPKLFQKMQIGIVPAGSGNAVCGSLGSLTVLDGIRRILQGNVQGFDLCKVKQPNTKDHLSIIFTGWGIIPACDFDSERNLRWMGKPRFTIWGVYEILKAKNYQGKVFSRKETLSSDEEKGEEKYLEDNPNWWMEEKPVPPPGWVDYGTACYNVFHCGVTPFLSTTTKICNKIQCGDGLMQLILVRNCTRVQLASMLLSLDDGSFVDSPSVIWQRTTSCVLLPDQEMNCLVDVDGERFKNARTHMEVMHNAVKLCC